MDVRRAPAVQLCRMLSIADVRKKIGMSPSDYDELKSKLSELQRSMPDMNEFILSDIRERELLLERLVVEAERMEPEIFAMLSKKLGRSGVDQLMGVYLHFYGDEGVLNQRISDRLQLTTEQRSKIEVAIAELKLEKTAVLSKIADGKGIEKDKIGPLLLMRADAYSPAIQATLTKDQQRELISLKGDRIWTDKGQPFTRLTFGW
ncbi:MAG: hypothetical protein SGI77_15545 [Pirellulaceae bacterium]|nr:hypothetical protein [Pirellulaceae bacterium]